MKAQGFNQLPNLDGDLDEWYRSISKETETPIMKGVYFFENELRPISATEHPFYGRVWDINGDVTFEGRQFKNLNIAYNIKKDFLLIWDWNMDKIGDKPLLVNQSKIDSFKIFDRRFVRSKYLGIDENGFSSVIMKGKKISCYTQKKKISINEDDGVNFKDKNKYFITYQNETYDYKKKSSLYKIFPDQKKLIRKYIAENVGFFEKDNDYHLQVVLEYCDLIVR